MITGKQPQCKPITCGQPPEVLNARFYLTNGTSTAWQSLARYSCKPGFKMIYQDSKYSYASLNSLVQTKLIKRITTDEKTKKIS